MDGQARRRLLVHLRKHALRLVGAPPADREIGPYWLAVIAANQDRLPDPGNPNLLFPGDVIVLPHPPQPVSTTRRKPSNTTKRPGPGGADPDYDR